MSALSLAGKHCAIVGATGIIGSAIARTFSQQGAVLSLISRTALDKQTRIEPLLKPFDLSASPKTDARPNPLPAAHRFFNLNVGNASDVKAAFGGRKKDVSFEDAEKVGPVDILVNCAGITQTSAFKRTSDEHIGDIIDTNLMATIWASKHAQLRNHGCIINVSSLLAIKAGAGATVYATSKAGILGLTRALSREYGPNSIRVNALLPGWVKSQMWDDLKDSLKQKHLDDTPLNRIADPEEVADAALFLATNKFANNCVLNLDGGLSAS